MSEQILAILRKQIDALSPSGDFDAETRRNALKEALQYYVLNFIYHHPEYSAWIMYGGSALRIIHGLDRMSVDLDFEIAHAVDEAFLAKLKQEIEEYFANTFGAGADFLTIKVTSGRGLILKFLLNEEMSFGNPSKQVHVKIDLNQFVAPKVVIERRPIVRDQLSFVIVTYNMSALMASKLAAIFLRGTRGIGEAKYEEKGRDIYDLLWYMNKKIVPDFDYLVAKGIEIKDPRALFEKLTAKMESVSDANLKQDLSPLFLDRGYIENWLQNWREQYRLLLENYKIRTVTELEQIFVRQNLYTDVYSFVFRYKTEEMESVQISYEVSYEWMEDREGVLSIKADPILENMVEFTSNGMHRPTAARERITVYATLFYQKTEAYLNKMNRVTLGEQIMTKTICLIAKKLDQKEQILLSPSRLLSCELDDLLK